MSVAQYGGGVAAATPDVELPRPAAGSLPRVEARPILTVSDPAKRERDSRLSLALRRAIDEGKEQRSTSAPWLAAVAVAEVQGVDGLKDLIGKQIGPGEWREVRQEDIDTFADLSGDHQWIHVDVERAKQESPFGTTIAHGNLTLSMIDGFRLDLITTTGFKLGVNYGWNKVRFPAPVPAGSRVRAKAEVVSVEEVGGGWWQVVTRFTVEVEGSEKPCCVADSVGRGLAA